MLNKILLSFIPLFVAVDAIGILPIFVSLTEAMERKVRTKVIIQSMLTAAGMAIGFVPTIVSILLNILIAGLLFRISF